MGYTKWKFSGIDGINYCFSVGFTLQIKFDFLLYIFARPFICFYGRFKIFIAGWSVMEIWDDFMQGVSWIVGKQFLKMSKRFCGIFEDFRRRNGLIAGCIFNKSIASPVNPSLSLKREEPDFVGITVRVPRLGSFPAQLVFP